MTRPKRSATWCGGKTACADRVDKEGKPEPCAHEDGNHVCMLVKGHGTNHLGSGNCRHHGGNTPNGIRHAQTEAAENAVAKLGLPAGSGDPFALLSKAVQHADGFLEATSTVMVGAVDATDKVPSKFTVDAAAALYEQAIRNAARVGKAAVDADVADRLAALDERAASLLMQFVRELIDRVVPAKKRPELEAWAAHRLAELGTEYSHGLAH